MAVQVGQILILNSTTIFQGYNYRVATCLVATFLAFFLIDTICYIKFSLLSAITSDH